MARDQLASARRPGGRVTAIPGTPVVDETALQGLVEDALPRAGIATNSLLDVEQALSPSTTSYTTVAVTARLRGGHALRLFLKDFGYSRLSKDNAENRRTSRSAWAALERK